MDLDRFYLFTGPANLHRVTNTGSFSIGGDGLPGGVVLVPMMFGAFVPGDVPVSVFAGAFLGGAAGDTIDVGVTTATETVVGDDTVIHEWVDDITTTETRVPALGAFDFHVQYLTRFAGITGGVFLD